MASIKDANWCFALGNMFVCFVILGLNTFSDAYVSQNDLTQRNDLWSPGHIAQTGVEHNKYPFQDPELPWEKRVDDLAGRLTLEEIVNQTTARYGHIVPAIPRLGIKPIQYITECLRGYTHQKSTSFPQALGLAASFSADLLESIGSAVGDEVRAYHNTNDNALYGLTCFSPVINILRHPLWGRNQETYGEDPYLSGQLGAAYVRGLQGNHPRYLRVAAGCKHFDAHGGPDNVPVRKFGFDANITDRDLHTTFLPQFEACMTAKPHNIMCSFNSINGVPSCANRYLLTDVLRTRWGYSGFVISDDSAVEYIFSEHHYNDSYTTAAAEAIKAGCNVELVGKFSPAFWNLPQAVQNRLMTEKEIRDNIKPVLLTRMKLGEFDPAEMNPYSKLPMSVVLSVKHRELAVVAAQKTFVLLKNDAKLLPLTRKYLNMAMVGPMANDTQAIMGDYAAATPEHLITTPYQGLQHLASNAKLASGCDDTECHHYSADDVKEVVTGSDLVIVCLGTGAAVEAENHDRRNIDLPGSQLILLQDAVEYSGDAPVILLLFNGGPLDVIWAKHNPRVSAIMECFFPAMATGEALRRVLTNEGGNSSPAGRLPVTWPARLDQVPPITDYTMKGRTYRYFTHEPLYPYGYGLSYSIFSYSDLLISPANVTRGQGVKVTVQVTNDGELNADEVVQVYISWPQATVDVARWQMVASRRVAVAVHTTTAVSFQLDPRQLSVWLDKERGFVMESGKVVLYVGGQQPHQATRNPSNTLHASFNVLP